MTNGDSAISTYFLTNPQSPYIQLPAHNKPHSGMHVYDRTLSNLAFGSSTLISVCLFLRAQNISTNYSFCSATKCNYVLAERLLRYIVRYIYIYRLRDRCGDGDKRRVISALSRILRALDNGRENSCVIGIDIYYDWKQYII